MVKVKNMNDMKNMESKAKRMKSVLSCLLAVLLLAVWKPVLVRADVIWEPYEDDFYSKHYEECEHVSADYLTNGEEGYVTVYLSPESSKEVAKIMNGVSFNVSFTWQDKDGTVWGIIELENYETKDGESVAAGEDFGWVSLKHMAKVYDNSDFLIEHQAEFAEYSGELDDYKVQERMVVWTYPGSGKIKCQLFEPMFDNDVPGYDHLYTDVEGNRWTYLGYYYGSVNGWVCIDDPESEEITLSYEPEITEEELILPEQPEEGLNSGGMDDSVPGLKLAAGLVAGVVAVTAGLIAVLFGKKKK